AARPAVRKSSSPSSISPRTGPDHASNRPHAPASTEAPGGNPAPRAATTNTSGMSRTQAKSPALYAAGREAPGRENNSAGRHPPPDTGGYGAPTSHPPAH